MYLMQILPIGTGPNWEYYSACVDRLDSEAWRCLVAAERQIVTVDRNEGDIVCSYWYPGNIVDDVGHCLVHVKEGTCA